MGFGREGPGLLEGEKRIVGIARTRISLDSMVAKEGLWDLTRGKGTLRGWGTRRGWRCPRCRWRRAAEPSRDAVVDGEGRRDVVFVDDDRLVARALHDRRAAFVVGGGEAVLQARHGRLSVRANDDLGAAFVVGGGE